jgi:Acyl-coenzyme A synthetases/AMP-(fatty) acid ligases
VRFSCANLWAKREYSLIGDLQYYSDESADMLCEKGFEKGDLVHGLPQAPLSVLGITILALHQLGAIILPVSMRAGEP